MIRTTRILEGLDDVPPEWVFEYYLGLEDKLVGQNVKINSIFNPGDITPSMCIYYNKDLGIYKFKDFSTGIGGNYWDLVKYLFPKDNNSELKHRLCKDFKTGKFKTSVKISTSFRVKEFTLRKWTEQDAKFWLKFGISSSTLDHFLVRPLKEVITEFTVGDNIKLSYLSGNYTYGYFTPGGDLYKIYRPFSIPKFITLNGQYLQGSGQIIGKKYLIILSSLKDMMSFYGFNINQTDIISPNSENSFIDINLINLWKVQYKKIITLFDNDQPGINAMERYKSLYGFPYAHLQLSKDLADSVKDFGVDKTRKELGNILKQIIHE